MKLQPGIHRLEFLKHNGKKVHSIPPFALFDVTKDNVELPLPGTMLTLNCISISMSSRDMSFSIVRIIQSSGVLCFQHCYKLKLND